MAKLAATPIEFIPNPEFLHPQAEELVLGPESALSQGAATAARRVNRRILDSLPPHLARLCSAPLLTPEEERALFRRMNFCRYRAATLAERLTPEAIDGATLRVVEQRLAEAERLRDRILAGNLRLVISVAKKFISPQTTFDELLSEGIFALMRAAEKFDYDRGFRFSTYATQVIRRTLYRLVVKRHEDQTRFATGAGEECFESEAPDERDSLPERQWPVLRRRMEELLGRLDQREQRIVRGRFAMAPEASVKTFQSLAGELGVSKERVRQLEQRAMKKLREWAEAAGWED